jgi:hypothetical protein
MLEEYEDGTGEEIEFDGIALCCEYIEYGSIERSFGLIMMKKITLMNKQ